MVGWTFKSKYSFEDKNFARIYRFYVLETPVSGVSVRGKSFKERNINMTSLNAAMKRATPFLKENWFDRKIDDISQCCKENGVFEKASLRKEIAIHSLNGKHCSGKTDSLFYAIRCAFAHGSFAVHSYKGKHSQSETYYLLENKDGNKLKARMVLQEKTLLSWIDIVELNPQPVKRRKKKGGVP